MLIFHYHVADARLRIVSERVDIIDNLIISVSVIFQYPQNDLKWLSLIYFISLSDIDFLMFGSDRSTQSASAEIKGKEYMEGERCCWFCFGRQVGIGNISFWLLVFKFPVQFKFWMLRNCLHKVHRTSVLKIECTSFLALYDEYTCLKLTTTPFKIVL